MKYADAAERMRKHGRRRGLPRLANNTHLVVPPPRMVPDLAAFVPQMFAVRYHITNVVTLLPDDSVILDHGSWTTVSTKDRMNQCVLLSLGMEVVGGIGSGWRDPHRTRFGNPIKPWRVLSKERVTTIRKRYQLAGHQLTQKLWDEVNEQASVPFEVGGRYKLVDGVVVHLGS